MKVVTPAPVQSCWVKEQQPKRKERRLIGRFFCSVSERRGGTQARIISRSEVCCKRRDMWTPPSRQMSRAEQRREAGTGRQAAPRSSAETARERNAAGCWPYITNSYLPEPKSCFSPTSRKPPQRSGWSYEDHCCWKYTLVMTDWAWRLKGCDKYQSDHKKMSQNSIHLLSTSRKIHKATNQCRTSFGNVLFKPRVTTFASCFPVSFILLNKKILK